MDQSGPEALMRAALQGADAVPDEEDGVAGVGPPRGNTGSTTADGGERAIGLSGTPSGNSEHSNQSKGSGGRKIGSDGEGKFLQTAACHA